ncbi:3-hydroxyacyl-CoA dehydrogenase family protein [Streptomyces monticola]|uniref:3-hydroxyacyl-CoA dehydrogenase family protein n=1 Tax=Streptomyces monticola TaxID=2666263 RepID=A0ABW2JWZ0_9ACTN
MQDPDQRQEFTQPQHAAQAAPAAPAVRTAVIGGGVIGISWTALFLAHGHRVTVSDPRPGIDREVHEGLLRIAPAMAALGRPLEAYEHRLTFEPDVARAVTGADAVQENGPERLDLKRQLWATIEAHAPAHALFATSTSGIPATDIAGALEQPERLVVGHPFNPPHLVPLVEVVPGARTSPETVERAVAFYRSLGKQPQVLRKEVPGFVANRLQSALFQECVALVADGVVTAAELDAIVTSSIGLRWAVAGPFRTFHLGGGPGGLPHFLDHFGAGLEKRWDQLGRPRLDEQTVALLSEQAERDFGARPVAALEDERDAAQIRLMHTLRPAPPTPSA